MRDAKSTNQPGLTDAERKEVIDNRREELVDQGFHRQVRNALQLVVDAARYVSETLAIGMQAVETYIS